MEASENSFVQLLDDSDDEADNEDISGVPYGLLAVAVESGDYEDSERESDAGWSSTIVQPSVVSFTEDGGIQNDDVYALSNLALSLYKSLMTGELVKLMNGESNCYGSAKYPTWSVLDEQEFYKFLAICFHMSIEKRSSLREYRSTRSIYSGSLAARLMTNNRFIGILTLSTSPTTIPRTRFPRVSTQATLKNQLTASVPKREHRSRCVECYRKLAKEQSAPYARSKHGK
ncbi:hypothetical protein V3C99_018478 [Haemonchus contortus]